MICKYKNVSWTELEKGCNNIVKQLQTWAAFQDPTGGNQVDVGVKAITKRVERPVDHIIGIVRGGMIPATIVSHKLNISKVYSIGTKLYVGGKKTADFTMYQDCIKDNTETFDNSTILIIDDISDTGETFRHVSKYIKSSCKDVTILTAALYMRAGSRYVPTFIHKQLNNNKWVRFPFEK